MDLRKDADFIIKASIGRVLPNEAVQRALADHFLDNDTYAGMNVYIVAIGKAAWKMAAAANELLADRISRGFVITKYGHVEAEIPHFECMEAGHPYPDENSFASTQKVMDFAKGLGQEDVVVFLISGGGSALFESPLVPGEQMDDITRQLLSCGANIDEVNTIRKRLSAVKGGRFAELCAPACVFSIVLSDVLGDRLDTIASGPAYPDASTAAEAKDIIARYGIKLSADAQRLIGRETPKRIDNVETHITGSVRQLCTAASDACKQCGYTPVVLTETLACEARDAGRWLAQITADYLGGETREEDFAENLAKYTEEEKLAEAIQGIAQAKSHGKPIAIIAGGETVVKLKGNGLGGRNQELALAAAGKIAGLVGAAIFSVGSDGTDGPTDAAGGYVDCETAEVLLGKGIDVQECLDNNDSYHALQACGGLINTGPTGTNVNDVAVCLISGNALAEYKQ